MNEFYQQKALIYSVADVECDSHPVLSALKLLRTTTPAGNVDPAQLIASLFSSSSLARLYLAIAPFSSFKAQSNDWGRDPTGERAVQIRDILESVKAVALRYDHRVINEMHFLYVMADRFPFSFQRILQPAIDSYTLHNPEFLRLQKRIIDVAASKSPELAEKYRLRGSKSPYSLVRIKDKILDYLKSVYYPYDQRMWHIYLDDKKTHGQLLAKVVLRSLQQQLHSYATDTVRHRVELNGTRSNATKLSRNCLPPRS